MARRRRNEVPLDEWIKEGKKLEQEQAADAIDASADPEPAQAAPTQQSEANAKGGDSAQAPEQPAQAAKCDGNHAAPVCDDPGCWHRDGFGLPDSSAPVDREQLVKRLNEENVAPITPPRHDSAEALSKWDAETADLVDQAERLAQEAEREWEEKHGEAAAAKNKFEKAVDDM